MEVVVPIKRGQQLFLCEIKAPRIYYTRNGDGLEILSGLKRQ